MDLGYRLRGRVPSRVDLRGAEVPGRSQVAQGPAARRAVLPEHRGPGEVAVPEDAGGAADDGVLWPRLRDEHVLPRVRKIIVVHRKTKESDQRFL